MVRSMVRMLAVSALLVPLVGHRVQAGDGSPAVRVAENGAPDADNSKKNVRDRDDQALTPLDQGGSEADRTITQQVRKAVVDHDGLSMDAKNVKIITRDGVVTLRGPVKTDEEKATIASISAKAAGVKRVDDQLEVTTQR